MRYAVIAGLVAMLACGEDTGPTGPGADDPILSAWRLTTLNGDSVPVELPTEQIILGGSITLYETGWYRLENEIDPPFTRDFVGRFVASGGSIEFSGSSSHGPMTGTIVGTDLVVEPANGAGSVATYAPEPVLPPQ